MPSSSIISAGYFTWLKFLLDQSPAQLENRIGYSPGTLAAGWLLLSPRAPLAPNNIDLRGSSRWPDGKLPDGRQIGSVISSRSDLAEAQNKLASFFDQGMDRRPAKVRPNLCPQAYPAATPTGIPQFKLVRAVEWVVLAKVDPGGVLQRSAIIF